MKKRLIGSLLMGAFLIASMSMFVSCKDYDDDINDIRAITTTNYNTLVEMVNGKTATLEASLSTLTTQLNDVKTAYAAADANLASAIQDAKSAAAAAQTAAEAAAAAAGDAKAAADKAYADAKADLAVVAAQVTNLQNEVANLAASKAVLEQAIANVNTALEAVKADVKAQGDAITALTAKDAELQTAIDKAAAAAAAAQSEADKAAAKAAEVAAALADAKTELAGVKKDQETIAANLATVSEKLASLETALRAEINALGETVKGLSEKAAANEAAIAALSAKLEALDASNKSILNQLGGFALSADLTAAQVELLEKIAAGDKEVLATVHATYDETLKNLLARIAQAEADIIKINDVTLEDIKRACKENAAIEVAKALADYMAEYSTTEQIQAWVNSAIEAAEPNATLKQYIADQIAADDVKVRAAVTAEIATALADYYKKGEVNTKISDLTTAYKNADTALDNKFAAQYADAKTAIELILAYLTNDAAGARAASATPLTDEVKAALDKLGNKSLTVAEIQSEILASAAFTAAVKNVVGEINNELINAITSINLFYSRHDYADEGMYGFDHTLTFVSVEEQDATFPWEAGITNEQITFKKGVFRTYTDSIMVRVSPVTAKLNAADIRLINSKGEDIVKSGLVKIEKVEKFDKYITRAETGLWTITFKLSDGVESYDADNFLAAKQTKVNGAYRNILYAIAVANTKDANAERFIVSEYDVDLATAPAQHAWPFDVNGVHVANIHNRYEYCEGQPATKTVTIPELAWIDDPLTNREAYTTVITEGPDANAVNRPLGGEFYDNRQASPLLSVVPGDDDIVIAYDALFGGLQTPIKAFYVTLDQDFALESYPSEINAWTAYDYDGTVGYKVVNNGVVKEIVKAPIQYGNVGAIRIKNAHNVIGDIIGFRVFAVNLDGTLVDPDGRAFYVKVVNEVNTDNAINIKITATKQTGSYNTKAATVNTEFDPYNKIIYKAQIEWLDGSDDIFYTVGTPFLTPQEGFNAAKNDVYFDENGAMYTSNGNYTSTTSIKGQRFQFSFRHADDKSYTPGIGLYNADDAIDRIMVTLPNANYLLDGGKYNFILKVIREEWENNTWDATTATWLTSGNMLSTDTIQFIPITVEKVLPVGIPEAFSVKTAQENNIKPLVFYMKPVQPASIGGFNTNIDVAPLAVPATKLGWMNAHYWEVTNDGSIPGTNDVVTHVADVYPFDLADVFNDLDEKVSATRPISLDQNYKFEFKESDVDADGKNISVILKATPASTVAVPQSNAFAFPSWNAGYADHFYSLPLIGKDFVSNISTNKYVDGTAATAKDVKASYIYRNVSLKKDASLPAGYYQGDFEQEDVNVTFTTKYRSAFDITKLALITDDQLKTESGITGTTAADKDNILKWQLQHRWFMQIVDYENGYNMNNWAYTKDKVVKVTVDGGKTIKSIDPQELVKTTAPTGTAREFSFDRVVYNFANPMGTYVAKNVFLARAGLIGSADTSWGTLANLKDAYIPSLWDLIQADIVAYVPNTLKIDIKDYFTPALTTVGGKRHGIYLNPTDRDLLHPAITAPVQHKVTFQVVDCFGFTQDLEVQFFMLVPRIDMTPARQQ